MTGDCTQCLHVQFGTRCTACTLRMPVSMSHAPPRPSRGPTSVTGTLTLGLSSRSRPRGRVSRREWCCPSARPARLRCAPGFAPTHTGISRIWTTHTPPERRAAPRRRQHPHPPTHARGRSARTQQGGFRSQARQGKARALARAVCPRAWWAASGGKAVLACAAPGANEKDQPLPQTPPPPRATEAGCDGAVLREGHAGVPCAAVHQPPRHSRAVGAVRARKSRRFGSASAPAAAAASGERCVTAPAP